jgi:uncharacterized membrane protein
METRLRSLAKSLSWRIVAAFVTFAISILVTHNLTFALTISIVEALSKVFLFYLHERLWIRIPLGRTTGIFESPDTLNSCLDGVETGK